MAKAPWTDKASQEEYISTMVRDIWTRYENETAKDRERFSLASNLFQGKMDWGQDREDQEWMSRPFLHEFSKIVRRVADASTAAVFEREDFFSLEPRDPSNDGNVELARIFEKIVAHDISSIKLPSLFNSYCLAGGITGMGIFKVYPALERVKSGKVIIREIEKDETNYLGQVEDSVKSETFSEDPETLEKEVRSELSDLFSGQSSQPDFENVPEERLELRIKGDIIDPRNFAWEPDAKTIFDSPVFIEKTYTHLYQIENEFKNGYYLKGSRKKLLDELNKSTQGMTSSRTGGEIQKTGTRDQVDTNSGYTPKLELYEYHGPVLTKQGEIVDGMENMHIITAGNKTVLRIRRLTHWSQQKPYLVSIFSKNPFKACGSGVSDSGIDQQLLINDIFASFIDMLKLAVYSPVVIDDNALKDPEEVEYGFYPGMVIKTFGKRAEDVFSHVPYNTQPGQWVFQALNQLRTSAESAAGVDVSSANPSSRTRITASEVESNVNRSSESVFVLAQELDENFIVPLITKIVEYRLQYGFEAEPLEDLVAAGVITESEKNIIADISKLERFNEIKMNFKTKVKGFKERIEKQVWLQNLTNFLGEVREFPEYARARIEYGNILEDVADNLGFDKKRWIAQAGPSDKAEEENKMLGNEQFVEVGVEDNDAAELLVHNEAYMKNPTNALIKHIGQHITRIQERGESLPNIPPQIAQQLGLVEQGQVPGQSKGLIQ